MVCIEGVYQMLMRANQCRRSSVWPADESDALSRGSSRKRRVRPRVTMHDNDRSHAQAGRPVSCSTGG